MLYAFFWVIRRRLNFICRRFGTLCLFQLHRRLSAYEGETECSETSTYKIQTPENYPEESIRQTMQLATNLLKMLQKLFNLIYLENWFLYG